MTTIRRITTRLFVLGLFTAACVGTGGCLALAAGAAAGVGTYAYVTGELTTLEEVPLERGWSAAKAAVADLQFTLKEERKDALQGRVVAEQADKTDVKISLESQGEKLTKFSIRVGTFGDEAKSRLIMDKIKAKL